MSDNIHSNAEENQRKKPDKFWNTLVTIMAVAFLFGVYKMVTYSADPAPSYQERRQQAIIKQNNQWRSSVCKDLGC